MFSCFAYMNDFFGSDKELHELTVDDVRAFCDFLDCIPANAKQRFPDKTITEAVKEASKRSDLKLLATKSKGLFRDRYQAVKTKKALFTTAQLNQLFSGAWFLDLLLEERTGSFWIPLIGLFHGCRLNEVCQPRLEHIVTSSELSYLLIQEGDEVQLKTKASNRTIPLHRELIKMGISRASVYVLNKEIKQKKLTAR